MLIDELSGSNYKFNIKKSNRDNSFRPDKMKRASFAIQNPHQSIEIKKLYGGTGGVIMWNSSNWNGGPNSFKETYRRPVIGLSHELGHAYSSMNGTQDSRPYDPQNPNPQLGEVKYDEYNAMKIENLIRVELGIPMRIGYTIYNDKIFFPFP